MRTYLQKAFLMTCLLALNAAACSPTPAEQAPYTPGFFYVSLSGDPALVIQDSPGSEPHRQIPLDSPTDCSFYALHPSPVGRWVAVEWDCSFGPAVELFDTTSATSHFALSNPSIDSRFLAWQPDGLWIFLKIGTLSVPQTLKVNVATGKAIEIPISPFSYDLANPPDGKHVLFSLTKGIGFGSETWLAGPEGQNPSQLLVDPANITALARYSPDGSQIAYIVFPDTQTAAPGGELWLMDANGFKQRRLAAADAGRGFAPAWSPDGTRIAFVGRDQANNPDSLNLSIYDLPGDRLLEEPVSPVTQPIWSPDGKLVAFSGKGSKGTVDGNPAGSVSDTINVWLYDVTSGQAHILVTNSCCAAWIR